MFSAAERGDAGTVNSTLKFGASVHTRLGFWDRYETALHRAALYRRAEVVRVLLDNGADVNAWTEGRDGTPLTYAILGGDVGIVKLLLARGANVNARDVRGQRGLSLAIRDGKAEIVQVLRDAGAVE